jgi:hypothetical protein
VSRAKRRERFERETFIDLAGMDHRQARRFVRRARRGQFAFLFDDFGLGVDWDALADAGIFSERIYHSSPPVLRLRPWIKHHRR